MKVAYVRVSTVEQNEARQVAELEKQGIEKWFIEKVSGKDTNRPELHAMLEFIREGDAVYVHDLSRLARSTSDLLKLIEQLEQKDVHLISCKEAIDTNTATGKLMITMIGAINEFERANLLERQREGIACAKAAGKYKGRQRIKIDGFSEIYDKYMRREINKSQIAQELHISRPTLDKLIREEALRRGKDVVDAKESL